VGAGANGPMSERLRVAQWLIVGICLVFALLVGRLAYIQVKLRPELLEWSERRQCSIVPLPGRRGTIYDRRQRVVAGSQDRPTIYADPRLIEDPADVSQQLGSLLQTNPAEILKLLENPTSPGYVVLRRGAEDMEVEGLRDLKPPVPGLNVLREPMRTYPMGSLASHMLGFLSSDQTGLEGLELSCEKYLKATPGKRTVYWDAHRRAMFQAPDSYVSPKDGMHVLLTIDAAIQETVERELSKSVDHFKAESGLAIVMNPKTGEVLSMACYPSFVPTQAGKAKPELRRNRILTDPVEPGSIFKPFIMAAALAEGVTKPAESIFCHGGLYVIGKRMLHDHHPYGNLTSSEIVAKSSNIGMAIIGQRLGNKKMYTALRDLGFGQTTGIDLPGEGEGLLMPLSVWNSYTTTSVPMGHELAVTPMQIMNAFCALVNGGRLVQPRVVAAVVDQEGRIVEDRTAVIERGQVLDPAAAMAMRDILVQVVNEGTGKVAQLDKWQVMGKTGTAQVPRSNRRGYEPDAYLGSFIAAAPASDPAVAVLVMVRKPSVRIGYYGAQVSAPVVKAILQEVLPYLNVPPDKTPTSPESQLAMDVHD
jgi:cell division protein FtsI/penicillin-binding protein 2